MKINVLYEDNHLLVVEKPINIPVCEDDSRDKDLLNMLKDYIKEKYNKPGNVYLGLVHRLDRPTMGVMVFAKTSKAASRLSEQIRNNAFEKKYVAIVNGVLPKKEDTLVDYLYKDTKKNISYVFFFFHILKVSLLSQFAQNMKKYTYFNPKRKYYVQ